MLFLFLFIMRSIGHITKLKKATPAMKQPLEKMLVRY